MKNKAGAKEKKVESMIKVIASDLDGTLLNTEHALDQRTYETIRQVQEQGIRFMIVTGRDFRSVMQALWEYDLECDYIVASGAEVRDSSGGILKSIPMERTYFQKIFDIAEEMGVFTRFCCNGRDYAIGEQEAVMKQWVSEAKLFFTNASDEEIMESEIYASTMRRMRCISNLQEFMDLNMPVFKIFITHPEVDVIKQLDKRLLGIPEIVSASSFPNNIELTHIDAQKGPVLKEYIKKLGYQMDEVMVLGDSMNDYSMISMDFGMTVAMENGMDEVKKAAKYITKNNGEFGVVHAIKEFVL